jgi:hypothetical protein
MAAFGFITREKFRFPKGLKQAVAPWLRAQTPGATIFPSLTAG